MTQQATNAACKSWDLTPYEIQRSPQEVITDKTEIAISPRSLHNELMCPICLDMLRNTMTTKECLHRFCNDCITTALRSGNKECPTCRKKLVSRRSLRHDPNFDALIEKIYPDRNEYDAFQEIVMKKITKHHNPAALSASIEEGLRSQALSRNQKTKKSESRGNKVSSEGSSNQGPRNSRDENGVVGNGTSKVEAKDDEASQVAPAPLVNGSSNNMNRKRPAPSDSAESSSKEIRCSENDNHQEQSIDIELRPHPNQLGTKTEQLIRKINTASHATMHHISQYLSIRISMEKPSESAAYGQTPSTLNHVDPNPQFSLFIKNQADDSFVELGYTETLQSLKEGRWKNEQRMQMYYLKKDLN